MAMNEEEMGMQSLVSKGAEAVILRTLSASETYLSALLTSASLFTPVYVFALTAANGSLEGNKPIALWRFIPAVCLIITALISIAARFPESTLFDLKDPFQIFQSQIVRATRMRIWCIWATVFVTAGLASSLFCLAYR